MDLNSLKDQVSNLTLYDIKAGVRKVQNGKPLIRSVAIYSRSHAITAVMNFTEMEAKVCPHLIKLLWPSLPLAGARSYQ